MTRVCSFSFQASYTFCPLLVSVFYSIIISVFHFFPTLDILELSLGHLAAHVFLDYALESGPLETGVAQEMDARCFGCSGDSTA